MMLTCSGGSNVGQLSNQAAKDVNKVIAIDGCQVGCTKAILEKNGIENSHYMVIIDLGIEKNKNFSLAIEDLDRVKKNQRNYRIDLSIIQKGNK